MSENGEIDEENAGQICDVPDENEICLACQKTFTARDHYIQCSFCELWSHAKCTGMATDSVKILASKKYEGMMWGCRACQSFAQKTWRRRLKKVYRGSGK